MFRTLILYVAVFFLLPAFYLDATLMETGKKSPSYTGKYLSTLRVPIGGLGAGNILLGGRGQIEHLEIFNHPNRVKKPEKTFFSLWVKQGGQPSVAKVLERELLPPFLDITHRYVNGLPRFREVKFFNAYPFCHLEYFDESVPVDISLEAYNPFIPLDLDNSSFPMVIFKWTVRNPTSHPVDLSLAFNIKNPIEQRETTNEFIENELFRGFEFSADPLSPEEQGSVIVATENPSPTIQTHWYRGRWIDDSHVFWDDFGDDGQIDPVTEKAVSKRGGENATVLVSKSLQPGESTTISFYLVWYFPDRIFTPRETFGIKQAAGVVFSNYYKTLFTSAEDVLETFLNNKEALEKRTRTFSNTLQESSFPAYIIDALTSQMSSLKTH